MSSHVFLLDLEPIPDSPRQARAFQGKVLSDCGQQRHVSTANVLVSELVTNAVVHAKSTVHMKVALLDQGLRVEVGDESSTPPRLVPPRPDDIAGRGLILVDSLADQWAYELAPDGGKTVWFQLDTS